MALVFFGYFHYMQFQESDLFFNFGPEWMARKYDKHRFYSRLSGVGLKAVDFITISNDNQLVLWEVKNFSRREAAHSHDPLKRIIEQESEFSSAMGQKVKDTFTALSAIHQYYRRKWSYRLRHWSMSYLQTLRTDWYFWLKAYQLASDPNHCRFILIMETDETHRLPDVYPPIKLELQQWVHQIDILDVNQANDIEGITVTV